WLIIRNIFTNFQPECILPFFATRWLWVTMMAVIIIAHALPEGVWDRAGMWYVRSPWVVKLIVFIIVVQLVIQFMSEEVSPFIYFQF
ncbi:MAG: hypothetical protein K2H98_03745, partial [Duncaniella sp.]|nr:hypothetical protein [Duncaniella sp.]